MQLEAIVQVCHAVLYVDSGAHGVGRRHIKNMLITTHPNRYAYPIPREYFHFGDFCIHGVFISSICLTYIRMLSSLLSYIPQCLIIYNNT